MRPIIKMNGGIGDMLLLTIIFKKIFNDTGKRVSLISEFEEIFLFNNSVHKVYKKENFLTHTRKLLGMNYHEITYRCWSHLLPDKKKLFNTHAIEQFCLQLNLRGRIPLKPEYFFSSHELPSIKQTASEHIVIQSQASNSNHPQTTKDWPAQRMQNVVDALKSTHRIIQLGSKQDFPLEGVDLLLGKTSIREAAILLKSAVCFIGLEGALMHLARAVECSSVIIWGGRLLPSQIGYPCFENIYQKMDCSPCWIPNACPHALACMDSITSDMVLERVDKIISQAPQPLPIDEIIVKDTIRSSEIKNQILDFPPHLDHLVSKDP